MAFTVLQMFAATTGGTENAAATIDIPEDGFIVGVKWAVGADLDADGEEYNAELSFIATTQGITNDARGVIDTVRARMALTTSGVSLTSINQYTPLDLPVAGGERLNINVKADAGLAANVNCLVHLVTRGGSVRRSARRR